MNQIKIITGYQKNTITTQSKILIVEGDEYFYDSDVIIIPLFPITKEEEIRKFKEIYGEEMYEYIQRQSILEEDEYIKTPGFRFRSNFVYFINERLIKTKENFEEVMKKIEIDIQENYMRKISIILKPFEEYKLADKRVITTDVIIEIILKWILTQEDIWSPIITLINNTKIKINKVKRIEKMIKEHKLIECNPNILIKKKDSQMMLTEMNIKKIVSSNQKEIFEHPNELLNIQGELFMVGNCLQMLSDVIDNFN